VRHRSPLALWNQWDTKWYLGIALHGYHWSLHGKSALAFFPLYPLLIHITVGWFRIPGLVSGLLLANAASFGALLYLYFFVNLEWGETAARRSVWLTAVFPTAFFTFAPYTEALFLLCATGALYHIRREQVWRAGFWIAAALLTRSTGIILIPAALVALRPLRPRTLLLILLPSLCAVAVFLHYLVGERIPLRALLVAQRAWHRGLTYPWTGFTASLQWLSGHAVRHVPWAIEDVLQLGVTVLFLGLTILAWRSLSRVTAAYCACFWLLTLTVPEWLDGYYAPFSSVDRFILALIPLAGWAAARLHREQFHRLGLLSTVLMLGSAAVHLGGGWVG
jgi:hypothetical protein